MKIPSSAWLLAAAFLVACTASDPPTTVVTGPVATPACGGEPVTQVATGSVSLADEKTYQLVPFEVPPGTQRVSVAYQWADQPGPPSTPLTQTVLDLGLRDADGVRDNAGLRGWSGSRQGRIHADQPPVFITATTADRGYTAGAIEAGTWHVELGIAAVAPQGATWRVEFTTECDIVGIPRTPPDPVDSGHIARQAADWYHGDFHMHGFHSNAAAPGQEEIVAVARAAGLDFLMITDYVIGRHWQEWGVTQRANPDLLIWPGREIITYFGHANTHGETPDVLEYRQGFEDVSLGQIQREAKAAGALFQINHPTIFPGPVFENLCRGCEFTLGDEIDFALVDTVEILTGPIIATGADLGLPLPGQIENPFLQTAINYWEDLLMQGFRVTAVSGSDSKGLEADAAAVERVGYGSSATAVFASELSRAGLREGIAAGRAYVRTRGALRSPELEFTALSAEGQQVMFGGSLAADSATLTARVRGGQGQILSYFRNGLLMRAVPITSDPFEHSLEAGRGLLDGPLGSIWRIETRDQQSRTAIGNPIFLSGAARP